MSDELAAMLSKVLGDDERAGSWKTTLGTIQYM